MASSVKVSIITPTLNAKSNIEECLVSVIKQSFQSIEHVIVDGQSYDGTLGIIKNYAERYPHIKFISEKDTGIYDAMNKGIDVAKGDWIYFMGADDVLYDDTIIEEVLNSEEANSFDVIYGNVLWGDTDKIYDGRFSLLKLMDKTMCHQSIFFRRSIFAKLGKFDTKYKIWADHVFNIKWLSANGVKYKYVDTVIAKYGINGFSSQNEDADFWRDSEQIFKENLPEEYLLLKQQIRNLQIENDAKSRHLAERDAQLAERDLQLAEREQMLARKDLRINELSRDIDERTRQLNANISAIQAIKGSISWKITAPLRGLADLCMHLKNPHSPSLHETLQSVRNKYLALKILGVEILKFVKREHRFPWPKEYPLLISTAVRLRDESLCRRIEPYESWCEVNRWNGNKQQLLQQRLENLSTTPLISIVMPVFNPPEVYFEKALQSVVSQQYGNWELCIADDASTKPTTRRLLERWAERDSRVRVMYRDTNGNISVASNSAAKMARGDYLLLMDQDDELSPDALAEVVLAIHDDPTIDVLYSDDDKIDSQGRRFDPQFKPDWSPELLLSYMYFSHLFVVKKNLYWAVGGMRAGFEGSQDFDLALRVTEIAGRIRHIPKILYHWRVLPGSTAASGDAKPASFEAGRKAVQEAMGRRHLPATVCQPDWAVRARCGIFTHDFPDSGPSVAIIIPTKNRVEILRQCIDSIKEKTTYVNYKVFVIDNESDDPETLEFLDQLPDTVLKIGNKGKFNYAAINNEAAKSVDADYILFLNNDTEIINPQWLSQMVGYLGIPGVGAVGAKLVFPDGRIQHAGIIHGYYDGMAGPAFKLLPSWNGGYLSYANVVRNYSAVTAACLLTRRDLFLDLGGFDEMAFAVAYNDVDYCYRLRERSYRVVYCPTAELTHYENYSRGSVDNPVEIAAFKNRYRQWNDPYFNSNLSLDDERFQVSGTVLAPLAMSPIKTLMCAFNLNLEGAPYSQFELTLYLKSRNIIEPVVYCPADGPLRHKYEEAGIPVEIFPHPLSGVHSLTEYSRGIEAFASKMRDMGVELVYGNTLQTFYAIHAAKKAGLPSIWNPRESEPWQTYFDFMGPAIAKKALGCFKYPYKVIFVADATRQGYLPLNTRLNFTTIHNGLNLDRFQGALGRWPHAEARNELKVAESELVILLLGTVCERKGQLDLVDAIRHLAEADIDRIRVFIVGDRPNSYSQSIWNCRQQLPESRQKRLHIIPEAHDTALYYAAADIFVCTSRIESYPRVILEAMASGLPIITTPVFGISEQVRERVNGLFYNPGDTVALASAISELINDDGLRSGMAENSRHVLATLNDFESMASAYGRIFREAWLSGGPRACAE